MDKHGIIKHMGATKNIKNMKKKLKTDYPLVN